MKIRPRPNLRGIDGLLRPIATHTAATIGAITMMASVFTDWNQPVGNTQPPKSRRTMYSARKVNELPACSKKHQNITLKKKMTSIAIVLSRTTAPPRMPSTISMTARMMNRVDSTPCSFSAPSFRTK